MDSPLRMEAIRTEPRSSRLARALGFSVLAHLVLLLLIQWIPLDFRQEREDLARFDPPEPPQELIHVSFVEPPPQEQRVPDSDIPPLPTPPGPVPTVELIPPPATELSPPPAPIDPPNDQVEPRPDAGALGKPDREEPGDSGDPGGAENDDRSKDGLNLDQAIRDFGRALADRPTPSPSNGDTSRGGFVPDFPALPTTGFGVGNLVFESQDYDWEDYGRQIYMAIWRAWHNRLWVLTDEFEKWAHQNQNWYLNHQTQVTFVIEQSGQVTGIVTEFVSGCDPLDQSAVEALDEVILPPLPSDFPRARETVHARFIATGPIPALRPTLRELKRRGLF